MIELLKKLIATPSLSRQEDATAVLLYDFLQQNGAAPRRVGNNVVALSENFDSSRPTLMLCSHHDTVPPASGYTLDPFTPLERDGRLYGLGSNDAGASLVALTGVFLRLRGEKLPVNFMLALVAEEECSGKNGLESILKEETGLPRPDMAIVGEPTGMEAAVGERGLLVLDCVSHGRSGHAARNEGVNALYAAIDDINVLRNLRLPVSPLLGETKITVTQIEAGTKHNVIPDVCRWVVDVRTTDAMPNEAVVERIRRAVNADVTPRSTRLRASAIVEEHPLVRAAVAAGATTALSQTMSDMALMPFPSLKIGPGNSARSHAPDEYIETAAIPAAVDFYEKIIRNLSFDSE